MPDSTPIRALKNQARAQAASAPAKLDKFADKSHEASASKLHDGTIRNLITIFFLFLFVVSDFFTNNIIAKCGKKTMHGRFPSAWGVVLQGVALVIGVSIMMYINKDSEF